MTATLTVDRLGHLGDGITDAQVVVVGGLPGEQVEGGVEDGRMPTPRILRPSSDRVSPPCPHAGPCGGCVTQHASDSLVAGWKRDLVADALRAQGISADFGATVTSPPGSRRRAGFAGRRTKKGAIIGFHGRRSHTLVQVPDCFVITNSLRAVQPTLAAMVKAAGSRKGEMTFLCTDTLGGVDVVASGGKPLDLELRQTLVEIGAVAGLARLTWDGEQIAEWADPSVIMGTARVKLPPGAFLQATAQGEAALLSVVDEVTAGASRIADLFCGCGTFTLPLADRADLWAFESDPAQIAALEMAWRVTPDLHRLTASVRDLFRRPLDRDDLKAIDAIVIDPPRAGAAAQCAALVASQVSRIAFVSCNPATFARDAKMLLDGGYRLGPVTVVDQFRWSPHVELAAGFFRD